ncbi:unnamed protein product [Periconia digitata]|uniref:Uncharacterized protein n=1 Tax=Periconia digitata TaxID=1303443 RepID=A0A9W4UMQ3_9PLEO|nr:unnamed protein product [Periconia digitata]
MRSFSFMILLGAALAVPMTQKDYTSGETAMPNGPTGTLSEQQNSGRNSSSQQGGSQQAGSQEGSGQQSGASNATCNAATAEKVGQLSGGIRTNVAIQDQELKSIAALQTLLLSNGTNTAVPGASQYEAERQALLVIQQMGVEIRTQNQKIAAEVGSGASNGLKTVEFAQQSEISQVKSLQGTQQADSKTLALLVKEVVDGTNQNWVNLLVAEQQCKQVQV